LPQRFLDTLNDSAGMRNGVDWQLTSNIRPVSAHYCVIHTDERHQHDFYSGKKSQECSAQGVHLLFPVSNRQDVFCPERAVLQIPQRTEMSGGSTSGREQSLRGESCLHTHPLRPATPLKVERCCPRYVRSTHTCTSRAPSLAVTWWSAIWLVVRGVQRANPWLLCSTTTANQPRGRGRRRRPPTL
jgi:hypothetical protein